MEMEETKEEHYDISVSLKRTYTYLVVIVICAFWFDENGMVFGTNTKFQNTTTTGRNELRQLSQNYSFICKTKDMCHQQISTSCCGYCSCHQRCVETGSCCPSALGMFWEVIQPTQECIPLSYKAPEYAWHQFMIASCPDTFRGPDVIKKCEERHSASDLSSFLPVDDRSKGNTYANRYCAECHYVTSANFVDWNAQVQCNYTAFTPRNHDTLLKDINETSDCDLVLKPVKNDYKKSCFSLVSSCNVTGQWEEFDKFTAQACRLFLAPYMEKYRNPFCAICNGKEIDPEKTCDRGGSHLRPSRDLIPFSALLQFQPKLEQTEIDSPGMRCKTDQIYDSVMAVCRDLECGFGKILKNGSCIPAYKTSSGICYKISVQFTVLENRTDLITDNETEKERTLADTDTLIMTIEIHIISFLEKYRSQQFISNISFYKAGNPGMGNIILADFLLNIENQIDVEELTLDLNTTFNGKTFDYAVSSNKSASVRADLIRLKGDVGDVIVSPWTNETVSPFHVSLINPYMQMNCIGQTVIMTSFIFHPFIRLDRNSYNWTINPLGVKIHSLDMFVENALFREGEDESTLFFSVTVLKDIFNEFADRAEVTVIVGVLSAEAEGILTLILVCTSILCLLLTLIVYSVLPALRSQPGINNMILSVFLIIAYVLFLSLSSQPESDIICQLLGGATHFAWLMALLWMNICSFHMFKVFRSMTKQHAAAGFKITTCVYITYCLLCASAVVSINVGVTYYTSNGESYGYGSAKTGICYIYDPSLTLFVITIPCIVIVTANIVMFFIVVYRLRCMPNVQRHVQNNRNYFLIHIRLSTLTGITWIVALPMVLTNLVVFTYVYIILVCSQGVYLMIAFVCNKRVFNLLVNKITAKTVSRKTTYATNITDTMSGSENNQTVSSRSIVSSRSRDKFEDVS